MSFALSPRDDAFGNFLSRVHGKVASTSFEALTAWRARLVQPNHLRLIRAVLIESGFCRGVRGASVEKKFLDWVNATQGAIFRRQSNDAAVSLQSNAGLN